MLNLQYVTESKMFIAILGLTIGLLGATASAGVGQLAMSYGGKYAWLQFLACLTMFIPSMLIFLLSSHALFANNIDFLVVVCLSLVPLAMIINIGREKANSLKLNQEANQI